MLKQDLTNDTITISPTKCFSIIILLLKIPSVLSVGNTVHSNIDTEVCGHIQFIEYIDCNII